MTACHQEGIGRRIRSQGYFRNVFRWAIQRICLPRSDEVRSKNSGFRNLSLQTYNSYRSAGGHPAGFDRELPRGLCGLCLAKKYESVVEQMADRMMPNGLDARVHRMWGS